MSKDLPLAAPGHPSQAEPRAEGALAAPTPDPAAKEPAMVSTLDFRNAMSLLTGAVNVVTTDGPAGLAGFTASAVCSVTDQPPTLLVCMNRSSFAHRFFIENGVLCVNVLSAQQQGLSGLFADRTATMAQRFAASPWQALQTGSPALDGSLASFDAQIVQTHEVGTHSVFYAELREVRFAQAEVPGGLVYFNRHYHHLQEGAPRGARGA